MGKNYIFDTVEQLAKKYGTRDPFEILSGMNVIVKESEEFQHLKGFCLTANRSYYIVINASLHLAEKKIVAAHELGHIILHRNILKLAPMKDNAMYDMTSETEYEANLFAANLLIPDQTVEEMANEEDMDYFKMCQNLCTSPDLMSFKLFSLIKRGHTYPMPLDINSKFLGK